MTEIGCSAILEKRAKSHDGANEIPDVEADHAGTRFPESLVLYLEEQLNPSSGTTRIHEIRAKCGLQ